MQLGFVDGRGRAYDITFRTLRTSLVDEEGVLVTEPGEGIRGQGAASASVEMAGRKPIPLLRTVPGEIIGTPRRVVFLAAAGLPRADPFTFFNVSLALHPSAISHFFTAQGGREFVSFSRGDVASYGRSGRALDVELVGTRVGAPSETARYRMRVDPANAAEALLASME